MDDTRINDDDALLPLDRLNLANADLARAQAELARAQASHIRVGVARLCAAHETPATTALPDIEQVAAEVHLAWMGSKRAAGVTSRKSESGEELMVPYEQLSEAAKELDRASVRAVCAAIERLRG